MEEYSARDRKRNSARKKSEFSVYSQKAVRAKEQQRAVGQNTCAAQAKNPGDKKNHLKTKNGS
jgi:hypothetical protein